MGNWAGLEESKLVKSKVRFLKVNTHVWNSIINCGLVHKPRGQEEAGSIHPHTKEKPPNYSKFPAPWGPESLCVRVVKGLWLLCFAPPLLFSHKVVPSSSISTVKFHIHREVPEPSAGFTATPRAHSAHAKFRTHQCCRQQQKLTQAVKFLWYKCLQELARKRNWIRANFHAPRETQCLIYPLAGCSTPRRIIPFSSPKVT